ncbi:TetR/AcrR family transcriptional regulator [uncultured Arthrobacter sp.]|uniref:TetR/AcrR family transcriptional regulator n=1 Tax=uncultured Arthrobacter sp. TaxID=114050 RepID=UPI0025DAF8C2|nr:TetR family transcriptional regulator [uncultured Arthrobacter sp.]
MAERRHDPQRRDRIIDSALAVIAGNGVAGTTHRKVAQHADVPLGSMTYHFTDMDELLLEAFTRYADRIFQRYSERVLAAHSIDDLIGAVADLVHRDLVQSPEDLVLSLELYTLAARQPEFRRITHRWMRNSRSALERFVDSETAFDLDALIEGLFIHTSLDQTARPRADTERAVRRLLT